MMSGAPVAAPPAAGAITFQAMNPASPEPKRPRRRDEAAAPAAVQDVTLPQVVSEVAALRSRFDRDEVFVEGIHSAVDANAIILAEVISRLENVEAKAIETGASVVKVRVDAEANDLRLDTQIRTELNVVTTRLGDELRAALLKVDESIGKLEAAAQSASASAAPPGVDQFAQINGRLNAIATTIQTMVEQYTRAMM